MPTLSERFQKTFILLFCVCIYFCLFFCSSDFWKENKHKYCRSIYILNSDLHVMCIFWDIFPGIVYSQSWSTLSLVSKTQTKSQENRQFWQHWASKRNCQGIGTMSPLIVFQCFGEAGSTSSSSPSTGFSSDVCFTKSGMRISSVARAAVERRQTMRAAPPGLAANVAEKSQTGPFTSFILGKLFTACGSCAVSNSVNNDRRSEGFTWVLCGNGCRRGKTRQPN